MKWLNLMNLERRRFEAMNEADRFAAFLLRQYNAPYVWGGESPEGADCSGSVCLALYAATGLLIRVSANDLYKRVFNIAGATTGIRAAFFITEDDRKDDGDLIKRNTAIHCAGVVGNGVVMNAQKGGAKPWTLADLSKWFAGKWCRAEVRGLDRKALEAMSVKGEVYGRDAALAKYFG